MRSIDEAATMLANKFGDFDWFISIGIMDDELVLMVTRYPATEVQALQDGFEGYKVNIDVMPGGVVARPAYPGE